MILHCRTTVLAFPARPRIMGIVNLNDDSFSGDGTLDVAAALKQAEEMLRDGADMIDIGAESARTNRGPITVEQEVSRLLPFIERWQDLMARFNREPRTENREPLLSINTWRTDVVRRILPFGGDILNDISALPTPHHAELCAEHAVALLIMHSVGEPKVPHTHIRHADIMAELERFFEDKIEMALAAGLSRDQIMLDPGIDFAKQRDDNLHLYRDLERLHRF